MIIKYPLVNFKTNNMIKENFFQKYQVLLSGIAGALVLVLQQFVSNAETQLDYKALGLAALVAIGGYLGNALRGRGTTIAGFVGIVGTAFATIQSTGNFTWSQFGLAVTIGFLAIVSSPPKPATYETNALIKEAKEVPPVQQTIDDTHLPNPLNPNKPI